MTSASQPGLGADLPRNLSPLYAGFSLLPPLLNRISTPHRNDSQAVMVSYLTAGEAFAREKLSPDAATPAAHTTWANKYRGVRHLLRTMADNGRQADD